MTQLATGKPVPMEIRRKLTAMLWRAKLVAVIRGLAAVTATLLTAVLLAVGVDHFLMGYVERYVILYEWPVRLAVTLSIVVAAVVVTALAVIRPLIRRFSDSGIAQTIEEYHPELEERLSSTVELLASGEPEVLRGSDEMIGILTDQASTSARRLSLRGIVSWDRTARHWAMAGLIALVAASIAYRWPGPFMLSLRRLFVANLERVGQVDLAILGEPDRVVPEGEPVMILAEARGQPVKSAWLLMRRSDDRLKTLAMSAAQDQPGVFTCTVPRTQGTWGYQVRAADSHTKWYTVRAVPRPYVMGIKVKVTPPAYSGGAGSTVDGFPDPLKVLRHSRIDLDVATNKPVAHGVLQFDRDRPVELTGAADGEGEHHYRATLTALADASFRILLVDEHRLDNVSPARHRIQVMRDEPPSVSIMQPGRRVTLKANDKLPIRFRAHDDMAITQAELIVTVGLDEPVALPIELPEGERRRVETETSLDLSELYTAEARQVTYRVRVSDSLPPSLDNGPQTAMTAEHEIMIDAEAQTFKMQVLKSVRKQFKTALDEIAKLLETSGTQTGELKTAGSKNQAYTREQGDQTQTVRKALRKAEKLSHEIAELTAYTDYRNLGRILGSEIADAHIAPAEQLVVQASLLPHDHAQRADRFGRAEFEIQRARERLTELAKQFDDTAAYQETAQALADAAARQAELAERIRKLSELDIDPDALGAASQPITTLPAGMEAVREGQQVVPGKPGEPVTTAPTSAPSLAKLTEDQQELVRAMQEIIAVNPDLWQPALEVQQARNKTLLEQLSDLGKRQEALSKLVNEQQTRDKVKSSREELAKAQTTLMAQIAKLVKDRAALLAQAGVEPADVQKLALAAARVLDERMNEAAELQSQSAAELAGIAKGAGAQAKKLTKGAPDPKGHQKLAGTSKDLAAQAAKLAQAQRQLAGETAKTAEQRGTQQKSLAEDDAKLRPQMTGLNKQQETLAADTASLIDRIRKHGSLSKELAGTLKTPAMTAGLKQAAGQLGQKRPDQAVSAQLSALKALEALGKAIGQSAGQVREEAKRFKAETDKWAAAEAKRVAAIKQYEAETARRAKAVKAWQVAEAKRKADLAKWQAQQEAKRKAAAAQAAKKAPTTAPAPTTQLAGKGPTTKPATSQKVAKVPPEKPPPPPEPPKALATPVPEPKFAPLAKPADKPAPKPQPKRPLWDQEQLKSADAFAVETAAVAKRLKALHGQTDVVAKQAKQLQDGQSALANQITQQDGGLANRQQALRKPANELVSKASKLGPELKKLVQASNPVPSMQAAARAITRHELSAAPKAQATSAERLEVLAKALQAESAKATAEAEAAAKAAAEAQRQAAAQQELAKQAGEFQKQQAQLHRRAKALGKRLAPLGAKLEDKIVSDLARQQTELAKEATELSDELAKPQQAEGVEMPAKPDPVAQAAAMEARKTAEALKAMSTPGQAPEKAGQETPGPAPSQEALGLQDQVARQLDRLVERLQEPVAEDPARWEAQAMEEYLRIQHAERAAELAARQRRLSRQLERTAAGKPMQAVAIEQAELGEKVQDFAQAAEFLAEQVEIMEPKMEAMKPKMLANAQKATELLAQTAPAAMDTAAKALHEDHASQALKPMGEARKAVADAHRLLGTLQGQMAKAASEAPAGSPSDEERSRRLTESLQDQYEALRRMLEAQEAAAGDASTDPAEAAAQAAAQAMRDKLAARAARAAANANAARMQASAREFLEAAWEAAGEKNIDPENAMIVPGVPMGGGNWRIVIPDSKILDLDLIGLTRSDWARLPGALRDQMIQAAEEKAPAEYREVIKRYFKSISQRAGAGWDKPLLVDTPKSDKPTKPESKTGKK